MRNIFLSLTVLFFSSCGNAQTSIPTPTPTPVEPKHERFTVVDANTLKTLPPVEESFQAKEDSFRIRLPRQLQSYNPAVFPKPGDMPISGNATWKMMEAEIQIRISPIPPGLISTWSQDQLAEELKKTVESSVGNVTGGKKVYDKEIKQGDLVGREIKVRAQGSDMIARLFYTNDRLYMLAAMLTTEPDAETLVKKAFDTFEITKE